MHLSRIKDFYVWIEAEAKILAPLAIAYAKAMPVTGGSPDPFASIEWSVQNPEASQEFNKALKASISKLSKEFPEEPQGEIGYSLGIHMAREMQRLNLGSLAFLFRGMF